MSFPWSYSVLGLIPGILLTLTIAMIVLYTSLTIWCVVYCLKDQIFKLLSKTCRKFCLRHPEVRDVCDISKILFFDSNIVWYIAAAMFLLNNTFIQVYCFTVTSLINLILRVTKRLGTSLPCRSRISEYCCRPSFLHSCLGFHNSNCVISVLFASDIRHFVENRHILSHRYLHLYTPRHNLRRYSR